MLDILSLWELPFAVLAFSVSVFAAIFSFRSAVEAKRANDIGRLNALLALRMHYVELMRQHVDSVEFFKGFPDVLENIQNIYGDLDKKLKEINLEVDRQHGNICRCS